MNVEGGGVLPPEAPIEVRRGRNGYWLSGRNDKGELRYIDKHALSVDHEYQREEKRLAVERIARAWSWLAAGTLVVGDRGNGELAVIDGQQRLAAAMKIPEISELPCNVFRVYSRKEEAAGFLAGNTERKQITAPDAFRARIAANDPSATLVLSVIKESGREIVNSAGNTVWCLNTLQKAARLDPARFRDMWALWHSVCAGRAIHKRIVEGLWYIEQRLPVPHSVLKNPLRQRILDVGADALLRGANRAVEYYGKGGERIVAEGFLQEINKGRRLRFFLEGNSIEQRKGRE